MIKGFCFSNLDEFMSGEWPTEFACRPEKGDWVESKTGKLLVVYGIYHKMIDGEAVLKIELNKWRSS